MTTVDRTNGNGMHVGVQYFRTTRHDLQFLRRHGGTHMDVTPDDFELTTLPQQRDEAATEGVSLEMIHILRAIHLTGVILS